MVDLGNGHSLGFTMDRIVLKKSVWSFRPIVVHTSFKLFRQLFFLGVLGLRVVWDLYWAVTSPFYPVLGVLKTNL